MAPNYYRIINVVLVCSFLWYYKSDPMHAARIILSSEKHHDILFFKPFGMLCNNLKY